jgi:hypothetical protein
VRLGGVGILATAISTVTNGTVVSGGTESFDTVLGFYQATLVSGQRYRVVYDGLVGNGSVVGDVFLLQIRNSGSASNPTISSTIVAQTEWGVVVTGTAGRAPLPLRNTFVASVTGVNTFGVSGLKTAGSGTFTPVTSSASGLRELYVEAV